MSWLVEQLFKWDRLRSYIFAEVDFYNSLTRILKDPEEMKITNAMWCEPDGWRSWHVKDDGNYFFNDIPEKSLTDIFETIYDKEELDNA